MMSQPSICDDERVVAFAKVAEQYCILIDSHEEISKQEFTKKVAVVLAKLYAAGVELIDVPVEQPESDDLTEWTIEDWQTIYDSLQNKWREDSLYWLVFDPHSEEAPIQSCLGDDLADIYGDLKPGISAFGRSENDSHCSVWTWRFNFLIHWGWHCSGSLRAIHSLLERWEEDSHFVVDS